MAIYSVVQVSESDFRIKKEWRFLWFKMVGWYNPWLVFGEWTNFTNAKPYTKTAAIYHAEDVSGERARKETELRQKVKAGLAGYETVWRSEKTRQYTSDEELTFQLGEALRAENYEVVESIMAQFKK